MYDLDIDSLEVDEWVEDDVDASVATDEELESIDETIVGRNSIISSPTLRRSVSASRTTSGASNLAFVSEGKPPSEEGNSNCSFI